jgi:hypothetical protein
MVEVGDQALQETCNFIRVTPVGTITQSKSRIT